MSEFEPVEIIIRYGERGEKYNTHIKMLIDKDMQANIHITKRTPEERVI